MNTILGKNMNFSNKFMLRIFLISYRYTAWYSIIYIYKPSNTYKCMLKSM